MTLISIKLNHINWLLENYLYIIILVLLVVLIVACFIYLLPCQTLPEINEESVNNNTNNASSLTEGQELRLQQTLDYKLKEKEKEEDRKVDLLLGTTEDGYVAVYPTCPFDESRFIGLFSNNPKYTVTRTKLFDPGWGLGIPYRNRLCALPTDQNTINPPYRIFPPGHFTREGHWIECVPSPGYTLTTGLVPVLKLNGKMRINTVSYYDNSTGRFDGHF